MENDHLRFACPSCGTNLTLPSAAAGVEGPCPTCSSIIRAPRPRAIRLEVQETAPARTKPVGNVQHAAPQPLPTSTVLLTSKRASLKRGAAIVACLLLIAGTACVVMLQDKAKPATGSPEVVSNAQTTPPQPLATPAPETKADIDPALDPRIPPEGMDVLALIHESADVLKQFIQAQTLAERLPIIETKTAREELEASVLSRPIPTRQRFQSIEVRYDKIGGAADVVFLGQMELPTSGAESHVLMVRKRGTQSPKVIVDPFLDGYGGRLRDFAAAPTAGQRTFQVIASVFNFCNDDEVPNAATKFTAKLSEAPGRPEIAEAYFAQLASVRERLEKLGVRYGHSTGITFALRWNAEDDPAKPFLEIVSVQSLDWND